MTLESSKTSIEFSNEKRYKYLITKFENSSDIIIRTLSDDEKVEIISNISVELICYYRPHSNVIEKGSCKDAYEEPEVGQKPSPEEGGSGFNWGGLLMAAGVQNAMGALPLSSCAAVCGAVLWDFSEQDDTNNYSWGDADKYINSRLLGICVGNKIYYNHEISNLPREITYKKNGYTYTYMLDEHKQYFMGLEMSSGPDITLKDGRVISDKKYEYKLVYTDEPKLLIGMIQVSPGKTSVAGKAKGESVKAEKVKETSYVKSIADLKNTENFRNSSLNHILEGEINRSGMAVGYHYEKFPTSKGKIIEETKSLPNDFGVYTGKVEVDGVIKKAKSSFFP